MADQSTIRILSCSGGATKGYGENLFIERLVQNSGWSFADFVASIDVMAGVSTGAILICGYANNMTTAEISDFYISEAPWIFTVRSAIDVGSNNASYPSNRPNSVQKAYFISTDEPFYKAVAETSNYGHARLHQQLVATFGTKKLSDLSKNIIIPAVQYDIQKPILFSNFSDTTYYIQSDDTIVDVCRCSSAAFPYLPKYEYNNNLYVDGAFYTNNAIKEAVNLGMRLKPNAKRIVIIDVGAGVGSLDFDSADPAIDGAITTLFRYLNMSLVMSEQNNSMHFSYINDRILKINGLPLYYYKWQPTFPATFPAEIDNSTAQWYAELADYIDENYAAEASKIAAITARWTM